MATNSGFIVKENAIVVSGLSGRFPKCANLDELEANLFDGVDMASMSSERFEATFWDGAARFGMIKGFEQFDAEFFGYSNQEANAIDSVERKCLEVAYETIVDAGLSLEMKGSRTAVFIGSCFELKSRRLTYFRRNLVTRVNHHFDLKGPVGNFDTGCSATGIAFHAFHEAIQLIKIAVCDQALVMSSNAVTQPFMSQFLAELNMISPEGKKRPWTRPRTASCTARPFAAFLSSG